VRASIASRVLLSAVIGFGLGVLMHFILYRVGLPVQPFIYQAF
jgi:hypothetical protein